MCKAVCNIQCTTRSNERYRQESRSCQQDKLPLSRPAALLIPSDINSLLYLWDEERTKPSSWVLSLPAKNDHPRGWHVEACGFMYLATKGMIFFSAVGIQFAARPVWWWVSAHGNAAVIKLWVVQFQQQQLYITARGRHGKFKYCGIVRTQLPGIKTRSVFKCEEPIRISRQPRSLRPIHYKSIQSNEGGGKSEEEGEQRDKD